MTIAAISISILGLIAAFMGYRRVSGGRGSTASPQRLRNELKQLTTKHRELVDSAVQLLEDAYGRSRQQIAAARETLRRLKSEAAAGLEQRAEHASAQLEALSSRLEERVRDLRNTTLSTARRAEKAIAQRVSHLKSRVMLLLAEEKAKRARSAMIDQRFAEAEEYLDESVQLMRRAIEELGSEGDYKSTVHNIRHAAHEAMTSLRAHAQFTASKMDRLLSESSRLIDQLEREETKAALGDRR